MTKVIILGEATPEKPKKPIEFVYTLSTANFNDINDIKFSNNTSLPFEWDKITLLYRNYFNGLDLFFCTNLLGNSNTRAIILGHFNDGVVE